MEQMMNDCRTERIAAGLERHFEHCDAMLNDCAAGIKARGNWGEQEVHCTVAFVKATTQIAREIARLEALSARDSENRGSIPQ